MRSIRWLVLSFFSLLLMACTVRIAYDWLDYIIPWYLDDYIELTSSQEAFFEDKLEIVLEWHRKSELQSYRELFDSFRQQMQSGISEPQALAHLLTLSASWKRMMQQAAPVLGGLAQRLSDEQVQGVMTSLTAQQQKKMDAYAKRSSDERMTEHKKKIKKQLEYWVGELSPAQEPLLSVWAQNKERTYASWLQYRKQWFSEMEMALAQRKTAGFPARFSTLLIDPESVADNTYIALADTYKYDMARWLVMLSHSLNPQQKQYLNAKLEEIVDDLTYLAKR